MSTSDTNTGLDPKESEAGSVVEDSYIITLEPDTTEQAFQEHKQLLEAICQKETDASGIKYGPEPYEFMYNPDGFKGYCGTFTPEIIDKLNELREVEYISPDIVWSIPPSEATRPGAQEYVDLTWEPEHHKPTFDWNRSQLDSLLLSGGPKSTPQQAKKPIIHPHGFWGLGAISHLEGTGNSYSANAGTGKGVNIYVIDTGIRKTHKDFGERAEWGTNFVNPATEEAATKKAATKKAATKKAANDKVNKVIYQDGNAGDDKGHGTQMAGVAGGAKCGAAKEATLIAVKVLDKEGTGEVATVIRGIMWSIKDAQKRKKPAVFVMSFGFDTGVARAFATKEYAKMRARMEKAGKEMAGKEKSDEQLAKEAVDKAVASLNGAVASATAAGYLCCVAAGNADVSAGLYSPAMAPDACTVGAVERDESGNLRRWQPEGPDAGYGSNFGPRIDLFAPGAEVTTCSHESDKRGFTAGPNDSGTSLAGSYVAGVAATLLSTDEYKDIDAAALRKLLIDKASTGLIKEDTVSLKGSHNRFLYNCSGK